MMGKSRKLRVPNFTVCLKEQDLIGSTFIATPRKTRRREIHPPPRSFAFLRARVFLSS